jgi:hypothetical protein
MVDANLKSSIYIKNSVKLAPVTVTPVLYLSNGKRLQLTNVNLEPSGTAVVNINKALADSDIAPWATLEGYVEIDYQWPWDALCVTVRSVDVAHSVIFTQNLLPVSRAATKPESTAEARTLEGMWWKHEPGVRGFVALSNPTEDPVSAQVQILDDRANVLGTHSLTISPHGTRTVDLVEMQSAPSTEGGIRVTYEGSEHGLLVVGGLEDLDTGFSASLPLHLPPQLSEKPSMLTYAAVGFMTGEADPMMRFPAGTAFTPYFILRNITAQAYVIQPKLYWMENSAPHSLQLPKISIAPSATEDLNLIALISAGTLRSFNGSLNLTFDFQGPRGALVMAGGSVDLKNTYVFEVRPQIVSESAARGLSYWSTANGDDTMINLWNPADEAQDFVLTLYFSDGHYKYPLHLGPKAAMMLNMSDILQSGLPDEDGNLMPPSVREGSAEISGPFGENQSILIAIDAGVFNVRKATCAPLCIDCSGATEAWIDANPFGVEVGKTTQETFTIQYRSGTQYDYTSSANWSSSNTGTATVKTGLVTGVSAGSPQLTATLEQEITGAICQPEQDGMPSCNYTLLSASAPGTVGIGLAVGTFRYSSVSGGICTYTLACPSGTTFSCSATTLTTPAPCPYEYMIQDAIYYKSGSKTICSFVGVATPSSAPVNCQ